MDDPQLIGQRIKSARRLKGMSQFDLAVAAKITNASVSRLENGLQLPRAATAKRVASALGVEVSDLVGSIHTVEQTQLETFGEQLARMEHKLDQLVRALSADSGEVVVALPLPAQLLRPSETHTPQAD